MSVGLWYWLLLILGAVFGGFRLVTPTAPPYFLWGLSLIEFLLFALVGYKVFGSPVQ